MEHETCTHSRFSAWNSSAFQSKNDFNLLLNLEETVGAILFRPLRISKLFSFNFFSLVVHTIAEISYLKKQNFYVLLYFPSS